MYVIILLLYCFIKIGLNTNEFHIFKNESSVEFCYGTNIDYVYIRSYEQKRKYLKEMKQFYVYCDESMKFYYF